LRIRDARRVLLGVRGVSTAWPQLPVPVEREVALTDEQRIAALYRSHGPAIFSRCRRILEDAAAAEDATQETFVRVQRHLARAPDGRAALAWIYRIATNYCLNEIRNRKVRAVPYDVLPERCGEPGAVERALTDADFARRLIRHAPEKLRVVAWMHHVDGMDQTEVAEVLDISRRTIVSRLSDFEQFARRFLQRSEERR